MTRKSTAQKRYMITAVSAGNAGLTQRPAIAERETGHVIQIFNSKSVHGQPNEILDYWTDGRGVTQFKIRMTDGYVKITRNQNSTS